MTQIGHDYLEANGFSQHQFIMFRHRDAEHPHLHILVNRIGYDGSVVSDSNDFSRSERILRELEKKYGLTEVVSSRQAKERAMTKNELEMVKRTGEESKKLKLQMTLRKTLQDHPGMNLHQFVSRLERQGINVLFNQASTGYVSGISYGLGDFVITGSKLGSDFKWRSIANRLGYEQGRDHSAISEANIRIKQRDLSQNWSPKPEKGFDLLKTLEAHPGDRAGEHESDRETILGRPRKKKKRRGRGI